jgi:integrase
VRADGVSSSGNVACVATVRGVTANFLAGYQRLDTRKRYKKDIVAWMRWCQGVGVHPLDCTTANAQAFVDWMVDNYSTITVISRRTGVSKWFDALVEAGLVPVHGFHSVVVPKRPPRKAYSGMPSDDEMRLIVDAAALLGPRWEWIVSMIGWAGCDCGEISRVTADDVRTWNGRTLVKVQSRRGRFREIPVDGRLEVLTLGLAAVFAPSTTLCGVSSASYMAQTVNKVARAAVGRSVTVHDMRRWAVRRQFERGVDPAVIARWLGHSTDQWVKETLLLNPVANVSFQDVVDLILVEPDGERFGSGTERDSLLHDSA